LTNIEKIIYPPNIGPNPIALPKNCINGVGYSFPPWGFEVAKLGLNLQTIHKDLHQLFYPNHTTFLVQSSVFFLLLLGGHFKIIEWPLWLAFYLPPVTLNCKSIFLENWWNISYFNCCWVEPCWAVLLVFWKSSGSGIRMFWKTWPSSFLKNYFHLLKTQARFQKFAKNNFTRVSKRQFSNISYQLVFKAGFHMPVIIDFLISSINV
jgi:hypothetical protein